MKKRILSLMLSASLMLGLAACNSTSDNTSTSDAASETATTATTEEATGTDTVAEGGELNILGWAGYIPDEVIADYEEATGVTVNYSTFSTNEEMYAKLESQQGVYDIVMASDYIIPNLTGDGLLEKLDTSRLANYGNINPGYLNQYYDPNSEYTIPYAPAIAMLVWDSARTDGDVSSYADLWNEAYSNSIVLLDGGRDIIGLALQSLGYSVNETDPDHLEEVKEKLLELKDNVQSFDANTPYNAMINGDAYIGYMYGSQAYEVIAAIDTAEFAYAEEGVGMYIDNLAMGANPPNEDNAYAFLDYMMDGEVSAKASMLINYPSCNAAAADYLTEEFLNNPVVNPSADVAERAETYADLGDVAVTYDEIWTAFKSN